MVLVEITAEVTALEAALDRVGLVVVIPVRVVVAAQVLVHQVVLPIVGLDVVAHVKQDVLDVPEIALADVVLVRDVLDVVLVHVLPHAETDVRLDVHHVAALAPEHAAEAVVTDAQPVAEMIVL